MEEAQEQENELCRTRLDIPVLDELILEYCIYRGIAGSSTIPLSDFANSFSKDCISPLSDGEASINNVGSDGFHEVYLDHAANREDDSDTHCSLERAANHEDCSTSTVDHLQSYSRRLRRSRHDASRERRRKRWRGRIDLLEMNSDITVSDKGNQSVMTSALDASTKRCWEDKVSSKLSSFQNASILDFRKYELVLEVKELASKGMVAEVFEELNSMDPEFFILNPTLLFQLKQVEFFDLVNSGNIQHALKIAISHLGPLASSNPDLVKPLKETLLILLTPNEETLRKAIPLSSLANSLQVAMGRRLGIEEPQLMKIMKATLHTHTEWFKLQMCKDRFEEFLKIDHLKEVDVQKNAATMEEGHADNSARVFSQNTSCSSNKLPEDNSSPSHASSNESLCDENAIIKVMEFLALPRADAIHLLMQYNGNAETVIQQIFS